MDLCRSLCDVYIGLIKGFHAGVCRDSIKVCIGPPCNVYTEFIQRSTPIMENQKGHET